jgi:hypothetical protein
MALVTPARRATRGRKKCLPATAGAGSSSDPSFADTCPWPSIRNTSGQAPIVAQGDQTDLSDGTVLPDRPGGKYLISVTADGFKIGGAHFTVNSGTQLVTADPDPTPLPLSTLRISVFNDNAPVDATYEVDAEAGLRGFTNQWVQTTTLEGGHDIWSQEGATSGSGFPVLPLSATVA